MATSRQRQGNSKSSFQIHNDDIRQDDSMEEEEIENEESRAEAEDDQQDDAYSEASDESDDSVDAATAEDIAKFEATFKGIKDRFRLINRIGEGNQKDLYVLIHILTRHRDIFYCL